MRHLAYIYLLVGTVALPQILVESNKFDHFQSLGEHILLEWNYDEETITFKLTSSKYGWIGVGFSPDGTMAGADLILTGVRYGKEYVFDAFATMNGVPDVDGEQNVEILDFKEEDGQTEIILKRKLDTEDSLDMKIKKGRMYVIWAFGVWDIRSSPNILNYHLWNRDSILMELIPQDDPEKYIKNPLISLSDDISLEWRYNHENIIFKITSYTDGWIGLGLSPDGTMAGADMMISGEKSGQCYIFDVFARSNGAPTVDDSQDVEILQCKREDHYLTVVLKRKLESADPFHDLNIEEGDMNLIWAYGHWNIWDVPRFYNYHLWNRGTTPVRLIQSVYDDEEEISGSEAPETPETSITTVLTDNSMPKLAFSIALSDEVMLEWFTDGTYIVFKITAPTLGWVGLGFSPTKTMRNADLILVGARTNGMGVREKYVVDAYAEDNETPKVDVSQDIVLRHTKENGTHTTVMFERLVDTGDAQDIRIKDRMMNILYAYGNDDIITVPTLDLYHGTNRGLKRLNLLRWSEMYFEPDWPYTQALETDPLQTEIYSWTSKTNVGSIQ